MSSIWEQADPGGPYGITQTLSAADADATALAVLPLFGDSLEARVVLAVGHADGVVRVWEVASGTLLASLQAHTEPLFSLAVLQVRDALFESTSRPTHQPNFQMIGLSGRECLYRASSTNTVANAVQPHV